MYSYPENLCIIPFIHLTSKPNGAARLCCFSTKYIRDKKGNQLFLGKDSLEKIWNSDEMQAIRIKMLNNDKLDECNHCWAEEANGKISKRLRENKRFLASHKLYLESARNNKGNISMQPSYLDLRLGNKCNLKCRTCNPLFSSLWHTEIKQNEKSMYKSPALKKVYQSDFNSSKNIRDWHETDIFFNTVKKTNKYLKLIYISGGEPFLIKGQHLFIDHFLKTGTYKKITVNINTNLTYLDKSLLRKLTHFKKVHLSVSVDAYGIKNDWIRSPSKFSKIEKNMETVLQLPENTEISINCTVSVYNILYISELIDWSRKISKKLNKTTPTVYFDLLHKPTFQQISVLPLSLKKKAIKRLDRIKEKELFSTEIEDINSLIKFLQSSAEENERTRTLRDQLKEHTRVFDKWRGENFLSVFPEFTGYL